VTDACGHCSISFVTMLPAPSWYSDWRFSQSTMSGTSVPTSSCDASFRSAGIVEIAAAVGAAGAAGHEERRGSERCRECKPAQGLGTEHGDRRLRNSIS
jgi:hypothetical protein